MGKEKGGFLTPKAIANRIKAKGLQKLRWYCQMCQKQCRDENGFKCHMMSESHQRQLLLFGEDPDKYIDTFSQDFENDYVELLRRRFGTKRVNANIVYQEHIADRHHTHMNSTKWETLTEFVKHLGREGKCAVDFTEKGWFVQYIDRDPETIRRAEAAKTKERMDMNDDEKMAKFIEKQMERVAETEKSKKEVEATELQRESEEEKVIFALGVAKKKEEEGEKKKRENPLSAPTKEVFKKPRAEPSTSQRDRKSLKRKSALDEIIEFESKKREKQNRRDYWLHKGIVVRITSKRLGENFYRKKAHVKEVQDLYTAVIKLLDSGKKLRIDQTHVETVLPAIGKTVLVVNGAYRGEEAILEEIKEDKFCCTIKISSGLLRGRVVEGVQYEDVSKIYHEES